MYGALFCVARRSLSGASAWSKAVCGDNFVFVLREFCCCQLTRREEMEDGLARAWRTDAYRSEDPYAASKNESAMLSETAMLSELLRETVFFEI